jgi:PAS domain S-box-containing protein
VAIDLNQKVTFFNDTAQDFMWWNPEKATGLEIHSVFRLEDKDETVVDEESWPTRITIEEGVTIETEAPAKPFYLRNRDKERYPVQMTISPILLEEEIAGALLIFRDITDEVEFDNRKSEFISIASHQLRSPMSAMKWMSDMLRRGDLGEMNAKQQEWADKIYDASEQMVDLVNVLLNISRLESGVKMNPKETDTAAFLDEVMKTTKPILQEKKQKFSYKGGSLPRAIFDPVMITEVLKNYISNASKYSPEGATVTVKAAMKDSSIHVSVTDKGMGIPKSAANQMFNKFFRAENAIQKQVKGTGLGLYYCKSAVRAHGGDVGFSSTEGKGSTFWFSLPILGPKKEK